MFTKFPSFLPNTNSNTNLWTTFLFVWLFVCFRKKIIAVFLTFFHYSKIDDQLFWFCFFFCLSYYHDWLAVNWTSFCTLFSSVSFRSFFSHFNNATNYKNDVRIDWQINLKKKIKLNRLRVFHWSMNRKKFDFTIFTVWIKLRVFVYTCRCMKSLNDHLLKFFFFAVLLITFFNF